MVSLRRFVIHGWVLSAVLFGTSCANAETLTLMSGGASKLIYLPVTLASRLGYFRSEGLDVQILSVPAGIDTSTELIAGAIQGAVGYYDHTIDLQSRGEDVEAVVIFGRSAGVAALASTKAEGRIRTMADAEGRKLGVTGFGASTWFLSRYLMRGAGVAPNAYTVVPLDSDRRFVDAMTNGTVDVGVIEEPTASRLISAGVAYVVVDMRTVEGTNAVLGGNYAGACLYLQRNWVSVHQDETRRLVRALVRALAFISTHSAGDIAAILPGDFIGTRESQYVKALSESIPSFSRDGRMPDGAPQTVLGVLAAVDPTISAQHVDLSRTYTNLFVDRANIDRSR